MRQQRIITKNHKHLTVIMVEGGLRSLLNVCNPGFLTISLDWCKIGNIDFYVHSKIQHGMRCQMKMGDLEIPKLTLKHLNHLEDHFPLPIHSSNTLHKIEIKKKTGHNKHESSWFLFQSSSYLGLVGRLLILKPEVHKKWVHYDLQHKLVSVAVKLERIGRKFGVRYDLIQMSSDTRKNQQTWFT